MSKGADSGPDSARSWAVAIAAFVINILLSGISRTTGLFYVALIDTYGISRMEANMPFTTRNIVRNLLGPLVGAIGHRYGAREVTMAGGLFAAVGVSLCAIAPHVIWISLFWGGLHGIGVALGNTLFQIVVNQYFEKHRATASGFAFSGGCVGSFAFPVILEYLLTHFGLSGSFLLTGALMLHVVPAGILMKKPPWIRKELKSTVKNTADLELPDVIKESPNKGNTIKLEKSESFDISEEIYAIAYRKRSPTSEIQTKNHQTEIENFENIKNKSHNQILEEQCTKKLVQKGGVMDDSPQSSMPEESFSISQATILMICDPMFHMISFSFAACIVLFDFSVTVIVDYLKDKGLQEEDGKYFISMISVGDFVGRLCLGWVTDRNYLSPARYMMLLQIVQGITFGLMILFHSFESLMILVVICGAAGGASIVMYPVLVVKYLPSVQSLAIGCICLAAGLVAFGIPPMIGYFRDTYGSYDGLYFIIGSLSIVTGLFWIAEPLLLKLKKKTETRHENKEKLREQKI